MGGSLGRYTGPMFTGLIEYCGRVVSRSAVPAGERLVVDVAGWGVVPRYGDSIAVQGCCLTVAEEPRAGVERLAFDVVPETLSKTTLGGLGPGSRVHLEASATLATLLGGHLVQGHVDGVGRVERIWTEGEWRVRVRPPSELMQYMTPKGSISVEGVSLTLAAVSPEEGWFELALIPTTLAKTTLGALKVGDGVNLECDAIGKTVVHWLRHYGGNRG